MWASKRERDEWRWRVSHQACNRQQQGCGFCLGWLRLLSVCLFIVCANVEHSDDWKQRRRSKPSMCQRISDDNTFGTKWRRTCLVWDKIKYPSSGKCFVSMATHLQLAFMKVICKWSEPRHSRSWNMRRQLPLWLRLIFGYYLNNRLRYISWANSGGRDIWNRVSECMGGVACMGVWGG